MTFHIPLTYSAAFLASKDVVVEIPSGRALLEIDDEGGHHVYGVQPGAAAGSDCDDITLAVKSFRDDLREIVRTIVECYPDTYTDDLRSWWDQLDADADAWETARHHLGGVVHLGELSSVDMAYAHERVVLS